MRPKKDQKHQKYQLCLSQGEVSAILSVNVPQRERPEKLSAFLPKEVRERMVYPQFIQDGMDAILQAGSDSDQRELVTQKFSIIPNIPGRYIGLRKISCSLQMSQCGGIDRICLYSGLGD
jgi:hypothetical protein